MDAEKNYLPGGITQEQLDAWKKNGKVLRIDVATKDGSATCYLKEADLKVLKRMFAVFRNDLIGAGEIAINNLWLGGDQCIKQPANVEEEGVRVAAAMEAISVINLPTATSEVLKN